MGANQIFDDKLGFSSPAKEKELSPTRFGSITETEPEKLKKHIQKVLPQLSFHEIKDVLSVIYKIKQKRFRGNVPPKYGSLNKGFSEQEVQAFFKAVDNPKLRLLFSFQAQLGLRIGEAVRINIKDMDFQPRRCMIRNHSTDCFRASRKTSPCSTKRSSLRIRRTMLRQYGRGFVMQE